jgi:hypothetical protein
MAPDSIVSYVSSIHREMNIKWMECAPLYHKARSDPRLKSVLEGCGKDYYASKGINGIKSKMPFTIEMVNPVPNAMAMFSNRGRPLRTGLQKIAETFCLRLGIGFMFRRSEFLPCRKRNTIIGGLALSCVNLIDDAGEFIHPPSYGKVRASYLSITIVASKTDRGKKRGRTRVLSAIKSSDTPSPFRTPYCLVKETEDWLIMLRDHKQANFKSPDEGGDYLFVIRGEVIIDIPHAAFVIKCTARYLHLDPVCFSLHSVRYGGVLMMASSGVSRSAIEYHGGWSKDSTTLARIYMMISNVNDDNDIADVLSTWQSYDGTGARLRHNTLSR